jgi:hypothetical protein
MPEFLIVAGRSAAGFPEVIGALTNTVISVWAMHWRSSNVVD